MLTQLKSNQRRQTLKQGFLYKRGGSRLLAHWKHKYVVLSWIAEKGPSSALISIYDKRYQVAAPKHEEGCGDMRVETVYEKFGSNIGLRIQGISLKYAFSITLAPGKKFLLATESKSEMDDWIQVLNEITSHKTGSNKPLIARSRYGSAYNLNSFQHDNSDAMSTYSDDSRYTVATQSQKDQPNFVPAECNDERASLSSGIETMSFYSEPVLTIEELSKMGTVVAPIATREMGKKRPLTDASYMQFDPQEWNAKFQRILETPVGDDEMILKRDIMMIQIIGQFQDYAKTQAKIIIDKIHLKNSIGSWAISQEGVIYNFIVDYFTSTKEAVEIAQKKANQELLGANSILGSNSLLNIALTCTIDYKGFTIVCIPECGKPQESKLVQELLTNHPVISDRIGKKLECASRHLNLKAHAVMLKDDKRLLIQTSINVQVYETIHKTDCVSRLEAIFPLDHCNSEFNASPSSDRSASPQKAANDLLLFTDKPNQNRRLRPEFLRSYPHQLCSDALTEWSACSKREREQNDKDVIRASRFLQESWVPAFVRKLDELEIRPVDSRNLSLELHRAGVNIRYLGLIAKTSKIPLVKELCYIDMLARSFKCLFRNRLRNSILHFRSVGATSIDDQMKEYAVSWFNGILGCGDNSIKFWNDKIKPELLQKFEFEMDAACFLSVHRPALFLALQYHCGVAFENGIDYTFDTITPVDTKRFIGYTPQVKIVGGASLLTILEETIFTTVKLPPDEILAYYLARHFKSLGPNSKLSKNEGSAQALTEIASHYNSTGRHEEAQSYAKSASAASRKDSCNQAFAIAQLIEAQSGMQLNTFASPETSLLALYKNSLVIAEYNWGSYHTVLMGLHDRMSAVFIKAQRPQEALNYHMNSLSIALRSLGKHHVLTAGYLVKTEEAIQKLGEARQIYQGLESDKKLVAEVYLHLADALYAKGDLDGAIANAHRCKKLREQTLGQYDARTVEIYMLLSKLVLVPYQDYKGGVLTPQIKASYTEAILCLEKVFRYIKIFNKSRGSTNGRNTHGGMQHHRSQSIMSQRSSVYSKISSSTGISQKAAVYIAGPYFTAPYTAAPTFAKNLLHQLTKQIVNLKLQLLENPKQKECVRTLRLELAESRGLNNGEEGFPAEDARQVILQMTAVTPSVYLDGILSRINEDDDTAIEEMNIVLQLTENETMPAVAAEGLRE